MFMSNTTYRQISKIALPVITANVLIPLQGLIDTAIVGHFHNAAFLSGLGLATGILALVYASFNFLQYATSGLSAQASGAKNYPRLQHIVWRGLLSALIIGWAILLLQKPIIHIANLYYGAPAQPTKIMGEYLRTRFWGSIAELGLYCTLGWFSGQGLGKYILCQQAVLVFSNISISLFLVYGCHLGIHGVAAGTASAAYLALVVSLVLIARRQLAHSLNFFTPDWRRILHWQDIKALLGLNRDLFIRTLSLTLCLSWFNRLASHLGDTVLAANVILLGLLSIAAYGLDGVAVAAESLTGQAIGAKNPHTFTQVLRKTLISGGLLGVLMTGLFALIFTPYSHLMTSLEDVRTYAYHYRWWAIFLPIIAVWAYLIDGYYFAATKAASLRNASAAVAIICIPLSSFLTHFWGNIGVWIGIYSFLILRSAFLYPRIQRLLPGV